MGRVWVLQDARRPSSSWRPALCLAMALLALAGGARPAAAAASHQHHRKETRGDSMRRQLLQSCGQCPSQADAEATCNAIPEADRMHIRNTLIANCGSALLTAGLGAGQCCSSLPKPGSADWTNYVACMCYSGDGLAGLSAFVSATDVLNACGCGQQPPDVSPSAISSMLGRSYSSGSSSTSTGTGGSSSSSSSSSSSTATVTGGGSASASGSSTTGGSSAQSIIQDVLGPSALQQGSGGNSSTNGTVGR